MSKHDNLSNFDKNDDFSNYGKKRWIFNFLAKNNETLCQIMKIYQILTENDDIWLDFNQIIGKVLQCIFLTIYSRPSSFVY